jgi:DNA mismatch repair protein MutS
LEKTMNPFAIHDEVKAEHADAIILVRVGDFYEAYDDAATLREVCNVVLASRAVDGERRPMAGLPGFSVDAYVRDLVEAGHRVAKVDEMTGIDMKEAT